MCVYASTSSIVGRAQCYSHPRVLLVPLNLRATKTRFIVCGNVLVDTVDLVGQKYGRVWAVCEESRIASSFSVTPDCGTRVINIDDRANGASREVAEDGSN